MLHLKDVECLSGDWELKDVRINGDRFEGEILVKVIGALKKTVKFDGLMIGTGTKMRLTRLTIGRNTYVTFAPDKDKDLTTHIIEMMIDSCKR